MVSSLPPPDFASLMQGIPSSTADHSTESLLKAQIAALELIASGAPLSEILKTLALAIEEQAAGQAVASIFLVDRDRRHLRVGAAPSLPDAFNRAVDGI